MVGLLGVITFGLTVVTEWFPSQDSSYHQTSINLQFLPFTGIHRVWLKYLRVIGCYRTVQMDLYQYQMWWMLRSTLTLSHSHVEPKLSRLFTIYEISLYTCSADVVTFCLTMSNPAGSCMGWERSLRTWKYACCSWIILDSTTLSWTLGWVPSMLTSLKWAWHNKKRWLVTCDAKFHGLEVCGFPRSEYCIKGLFYPLTHHRVSSLVRQWVIATPPVPWVKIMTWRYVKIEPQQVAWMPWFCFLIAPYSTHGL